MTDQPLSQYISLNRRYSRSVNLERDLEIPSSLEGYVLTDRAEVSEWLKSKSYVYFNDLEKN